jgi:hypothetical protein
MSQGLPVGDWNVKAAPAEAREDVGNTPLRICIALVGGTGFDEALDEAASLARRGLSREAEESFRRDSEGSLELLLKAHNHLRP